MLAKVFADAGWECPRILAALANVGSIYFDRVSQITRLLRLPFVMDFLFGRAIREEIKLPDYGF